MTSIDEDALLPLSVEVHGDETSARGGMIVRSSKNRDDDADEDLEISPPESTEILPEDLQLEFGRQVAAVLLAHRNPDLRSFGLRIQDVQVGISAKVGNTLVASVRLVEENILPQKGGVAELSVEINGYDNPVEGGTETTTFSLFSHLVPK